MHGYPPPPPGTTPPPLGTTPVHHLAEDRLVYSTAAVALALRAAGGRFLDVPAPLSYLPDSVSCRPVLAGPGSSFGKSCTRVPSVLSPTLSCPHACPRSQTVQSRS